MNRWLKGNGYWCPDCRGTGCGALTDRIEYEGGGYCQFYEKCPTCNGDKRIGTSPAQVIAGVVPATPAPVAHTILVQTIEYGRKRRRETIGTAEAETP